MLHLLPPCAELLAVPETLHIRMLTGKPKPDQVRNSSAQVVAVTCENCRLQSGDRSGHYGLGIGLVSLLYLVIKTMHLPDAAESIEERMTSPIKIKV
jgi:hypothetical protein